MTLSYKAFSGIITFTRGSSATRVNASGFIETVANDVPRIDFTPVTLAPRGLLVEGQRTNRVLRSAEFDNAAWSKNNSTVAANTSNGPDNTLSADRITANTTNSAVGIFQTVTVNVGDTMSVCAKQGSARYVALINATTGGAWAQFDLQTGTVISSANCTASMEAYGNGFWRCIAANVTAGGSFFIVQALSSTNTSNPWTSIATTSGHTIEIFGAQLEAGRFASSYIPTVGSQVTRSADVPVISGTNFSNWFNPVEGSVLAEYRLLGNNAVGGDAALVMSIGSGGSAIYLNNDPSNIQLINYVSGVPDVFITPRAGTPPVGSTLKFAAAFKANDYAASVDGASAVTDTSAVVPSMSQLLLGHGGSGALALFGHLRRVTFYPSRLSNTELQSLAA